MEPICFRLDHFLALLQDIKTALINTEFLIIENDGDLIKAQVVNTFQIFDGREFTITFTKAFKRIRLASKSYTYEYSDKVKVLSAENIQVYYSHRSQAAYFRNNKNSTSMIKIFENCLTQDILDLLTKHQNEAEIIDLYFQELYAQEDYSCNIVAPKKVSRQLVSKIKISSQKPGSLNYIKKYAGKIKVPFNNYAYQLHQFNATTKEALITSTPMIISKESSEIKHITAQEPLVCLSGSELPNIHQDTEHKSPSELDGDNELAELFFDELEIKNSISLNSEESTSSKLYLKELLNPYCKKDTDYPPKEIPQLDLEPVALEHNADTKTIAQAPFPDFDLGFIDCQAPHKFDFNLPIPRKVTGWIKRIKEHLQLPRSFYITATNKQDISFKGRLMAESETAEAKLTLYQTMAGQWVAVQQTNDNTDQNSTEVCVSKEQCDILDFFGFSEEAKEIYYQSGIDSSRFIS